MISTVDAYKALVIQRDWSNLKGSYAQAPLWEKSSYCESAIDHMCLESVYSPQSFPLLPMHHTPKFQNAALLLLRLIIGAIFLFAGYAKLMFWSGTLPEGISMPAGMVYFMQFLSIVEPLGGLALIAGFLTFWASAGLAIIMVGAFCIVKFQMGAPFFTGAVGSGADYIVLILAGCIVLMAFGGGNYSMDKIMKKSLQ